MIGQVLQAGLSLLCILAEFSCRIGRPSLQWFMAASLMHTIAIASLADSPNSGWLYVLDPRFELRVWPMSDGMEYGIRIYGSSPGVPDELLDQFGGRLMRDSENQWANGGTLFIQGNPGDPSLRIKFTAQGRRNWSARKRNYYPGKEWDTLTLVPTGLLPGITGIYENNGESGPSFDECLTLQEVSGGVLFNLEFAMAGEELMHRFARQVSKHHFLFRQSASDSKSKGALMELEIDTGDVSNQTETGMDRMAYTAILTASDADTLSFPWNQIHHRSYQKLAPGGISPRMFRLRSKPMNPTLAESLEKIRKADALFPTDAKRAAALYSEASGQLGGGTGLAQALADRRSNWKMLRAAIENACMGTDFGLETLWRELGWSHGDLYIDPAFILKAHSAAGIDPMERDITKWECMQIALECGDLDLNAFLLEHHLQAEDLRSSPYAIWELAQEASRGGRFGGPNPKLALQLVVRGGGNLEEREAAIRQCHAILKGVRSEPFQLDNCIRSRVGKAYLLSRPAPQRINAANGAAALSANLETSALRASFAEAFESAQKFFGEESQHYSGCLGFFTWESNRLAYQHSRLHEFLDDMHAIVSGNLPYISAGDGDSATSLEELTKELHLFMRGPLDEVIGEGQDPALEDSFYFAKGEGTELHQKWKKHQEAVAKFLYAVKPQRTKEEWRRWMNEQRTAFLVRFKNGHR
jgi:hypothetical protein